MMRLWFLFTVGHLCVDALPCLREQFYDAAHVLSTTGSVPDGTQETSASVICRTGFDKGGGRITGSITCSSGTWVGFFDGCYPVCADPSTPNIVAPGVTLTTSPTGATTTHGEFVSVTTTTCGDWWVLHTNTLDGLTIQCWKGRYRSYNDFTFDTLCKAQNGATSFCRGLPLDTPFTYNSTHGTVPVGGRVVPTSCSALASGTAWGHAECTEDGWVVRAGGCFLSCGDVPSSVSNGVTPLPPPGPYNHLDSVTGPACLDSSIPTATCIDGRWIGRLNCPMSPCEGALVQPGYVSAQKGGSTTTPHGSKLSITYSYTCDAGWSGGSPSADGVLCEDGVFLGRLVGCTPSLPTVCYPLEAAGYDFKFDLTNGMIDTGFPIQCGAGYYRRLTAITTPTCVSQYWIGSFSGCDQCAPTYGVCSESPCQEADGYDCVNVFVSEGISRRCCRTAAAVSPLYALLRPMYANAVSTVGAFTSGGYGTKTVFGPRDSGLFFVLRSGFSAGPTFATDATTLSMFYIDPVTLAVQLTDTLDGTVVTGGLGGTATEQLMHDFAVTDTEVVFPGVQKAYAVLFDQTTRTFGAGRTVSEIATGHAGLSSGYRVAADGIYIAYPAVELMNGVEFPSVSYSPRSSAVLVRASDRREFGRPLTGVEYPQLFSLVWPWVAWGDPLDPSTDNSETGSAGVDVGAVSMINLLTSERVFLKPPAPYRLNNGKFGAAVAMSGPLVVIGAPNMPSCSQGTAGWKSDSWPLAVANTCTDYGVAFLFRRSGALWLEEAAVFVPRGFPTTGRTFPPRVGSSVSISASDGGVETVLVAAQLGLCGEGVRRVGETDYSCETTMPRSVMVVRNLRVVGTTEQSVWTHTSYVNYNDPRPHSHVWADGGGSGSWGDYIAMRDSRVLAISSYDSNIYLPPGGGGVIADPELTPPTCIGCPGADPHGAVFLVGPLVTEPSACYVSPQNVVPIRYVIAGDCPAGSSDAQWCPYECDSANGYCGSATGGVKCGDGVWLSVNPGGCEPCPCPAYSAGNVVGGALCVDVRWGERCYVDCAAGCEVPSPAYINCVYSPGVGPVWSTVGVPSDTACTLCPATTCDIALASPPTSRNVVKMTGKIPVGGSWTPPCKIGYTGGTGTITCTAAPNIFDYSSLFTCTEVLCNPASLPSVASPYGVTGTASCGGACSHGYIERFTTCSGGLCGGADVHFRCEEGTWTFYYQQSFDCRPCRTCAAIQPGEVEGWYALTPDRVAHGSTGSVDCVLGRCNPVSSPTCDDGKWGTGGYNGCGLCSASCSNPYTPASTRVVIASAAPDCAANAPNGAKCSVLCDVVNGWCGPRPVGYGLCVSSAAPGQWDPYFDELDCVPCARPCPTSVVASEGYLISTQPCTGPKASGSTCTVIGCDFGYTPSGPLLGPTCTDGAWDGRFSGCSPGTCTPPALPLAYTFAPAVCNSNPVPHGTACTVKCAAGMCGSAGHSITQCEFGSFTPPATASGCSPCPCNGTPPNPPGPSYEVVIRSCVPPQPDGAVCTANCMGGGVPISTPVCTGGTWIGVWAGC